MLAAYIEGRTCPDTKHKKFDHNYDGGSIMPTLTFAAVYEHAHVCRAPRVPTACSVTQLRDFAMQCERLQLYALAAHAFGKLIRIDPAERKQYVGHLIYNLRIVRGLHFGTIPPIPAN
jgi:hypothetical protein